MAASVKLATDTEPGVVTFYSKDLGDKGHPLVSSQAPLTIRSEVANPASIRLGGYAPHRDAGFDGLIDEVRLSDGCLPQGELLFPESRPNPKTAGYWRFEPDSGVFRDSSPHGIDIRPPSLKPIDRSAAAMIDLCHVLLISNEFLYID